MSDSLTGPYSPQCGLDGGRGAFLGLDTIAFQGRVRAADTQGLPTFDALRNVDWESGEIHRDRTISRLPSGARLTISRAARTGLVAGVEGSLPKIVTGSNFTPLSVADAFTVMQGLYDEAKSHLRWLQPLEQMRLTRVDATGHIHDVTELDRLLRTIGLLPMPRFPPSDLRLDPNRGGALTLARGPGRRWKMVAYNKEAEIAARASRGTGEARDAAQRDLRRARGVLRCELVLRRPFLTTMGLETVESLDEVRLADEHRRRFHEVGLGVSVLGMGAVVGRVMNITELEPQSRMMMLAVLVCDFYGVESGLKRDTVLKYRKAARDLGLSAESIAEVGVPFHLDYDLARQVREAA